MVKRKRRHLTIGDFLRRKKLPNLSKYTDAEVLIFHGLTHREMNLPMHIHVYKEIEKRGLEHNDVDILDSQATVCSLVEADINEFSDSELVASWKMLASCWSLYRRYYDFQFSRKDLLKQGFLVSKELGKRGLLGTVTFNDEHQEEFMERTSRASKPENIAELYASFQEAVPVDRTLVRFTTKNGDSTIAINTVDKKQIARAVLSRQLEVMSDINVIQAGDIGEPLYRLVLYKVPRREEREVMSFDKVKPLRPRSNVKGNIFVNFSELWHTWASRYIQQGIIVQPILSGRLWSIHLTKDKNVIMGDKQDDITNEMSETKEKLQEFTGEGVYLAEWSPDHAELRFYDTLRDSDESLHEEPYLERLQRTIKAFPEENLLPSVIVYSLAGLVEAISLFNGKVHLRSPHAKYVFTGRTRMFADYSGDKIVSLSLLHCPFYKNANVCLSDREVDDDILCELAGRYRCPYLSDEFYVIRKGEEK